MATGKEDARICQELHLLNKVGVILSCGRHNYEETRDRLISGLIVVPKGYRSIISSIFKINKISPRKTPEDIHMWLRENISSSVNNNNNELDVNTLGVRELVKAIIERISSTNKTKSSLLEENAALGYLLVLHKEKYLFEYITNKAETSWENV